MSEYDLMNKNHTLMRFMVCFDETTGEYNCESLEKAVRKQIRVICS